MYDELTKLLRQQCDSIVPECVACKEETDRGGFMLSNTVFVMKTKKDSMRKRNFVCICVTNFCFASVRAGRGARHTDFHSMLVLLGGICLPEQDALYEILFFY